MVQSLISEQTDQEIARLFKAGISGKLIGQTLGMTAVGVFQRLKRMREAGMDLPNTFQPKLGLDSNAERDPRRASILHLLDLKRAGHSPTQTEFLITSERPLARSSYIHHGSLVGSSAAMCEAS